MFAQTHHASMRHVAPVRVELGTRTIFNLLGPLSNPAGVKRQLLGVFSEVWLEPLTQVLKELGSERVWTVHGSDGLDEITTTGPTHVAALENGTIRRFIDHARGGRPAGGKARGPQGRRSRRTTRRSFARCSTACRTPYRDIALLNAAASLVVAERSRRPARRCRPRRPRPRQRRRESDARPSDQAVERVTGDRAMSDVLARIEAYKRQEIAAAKAAVPPGRDRAAGRAPPRRRAALRPPSRRISAQGRRRSSPRSRRRARPKA